MASNPDCNETIRLITAHIYDNKKNNNACRCCIALSACQESLEDRAAREAKEYTEKNCPVQINEAIVTDSMTFDKQTLTLHYYLSVKGPADTTAIANSEIKEDMIKALRGTTSVRPYKEAGYNFMYTFTQQSIRERNSSRQPSRKATTNNRNAETASVRK